MKTSHISYNSINLQFYVYAETHMKHKSDFNKLFAIEVEALFTKGHSTNESITLDKVLGCLKL